MFAFILVPNNEYDYYNDVIVVEENNNDASKNETSWFFIETPPAAQLNDLENYIWENDYIWENGEPDKKLLQLCLEKAEIENDENLVKILKSYSDAVWWQQPSVKIVLFCNFFIAHFDWSRVNSSRFAKKHKKKKI